MSQIDLGYGGGKFTFDHDASRFHVLHPPDEGPTLSDVELGRRFDEPIGSPPLEKIVCTGESVLIVVPDATRQTACGQVINLLVRRLIAGGTPGHDIRIIFSTGIHRRVTEEEKHSILTPFIAQRIKTLDHDARDLARIVSLGETPRGTIAELDRALIEHDRVILVGGVTFHYFAGFTGGRKLICPGLASGRTVSETHKLAFDCQTGSRRAGVGTALLDGNAVHEEFVEVVKKRAPDFCISSIVNDRGEAIELFCGDWELSHRRACEFYAAGHTMDIVEKRDLVIVSCGGSPYDINLIQAHKALEAAAAACRDGGSIILSAQCPDGLGRNDFLRWFDAADSGDLARRLCEKYRVNGQTAWSLLTKSERFKISLVTDLDKGDLSRMRLDKIEPSDLGSLLSGPGPSGYIIPNGSKILINFLP